MVQQHAPSRPCPPIPAFGQATQPESAYASTVHSQLQSYNPLQGVAFEINPIYLRSASKQPTEDEMNVEKFTKKYSSAVTTPPPVNEFDYDFQLERSCIIAISS